VPDDSSRSIARTAGRVVRALIYVGLAGVVLFFALTRTEVGRDGVRRQIEATFDERFAGSLQIGTLQGTLLYDLYATDVRLRDEEGRLVATIDSVTAEPQWQDLLTARLSVGSLTLFRPHLRLHRRADRTWNLRHALEPTTPTQGSRALDVSFADVEIREGEITTSRTGAAPSPVADQWLFDYTQSEVDRIQARATIRWARDHRHVEVAPLQFRLPDRDLALESARVDLREQSDQWTLDTLSLQLGDTDLHAKGRLQSAPGDSARRVAEVQLEESRLDYDQLRRLVPRLPLRDAVTVEARAGGSLDRLVVNTLQVSHGASSVNLEGTAYGLPDSLDLDAQLRSSGLRPTDLRSVWPGAPLGDMQAVGALDLSATVDGWVDWREPSGSAFDLESTLSARGTPGAVRGSLDVARSADAPLRYTGSLRADSLDLAPLTGNSRLASRLTGRVKVDGRDTRLSHVQGTLQASLDAGRVGPRRFATADLQLSAGPERAEGRLTLQQAEGGRLRAQGTLQTGAPVSEYEMEADFRTFNLDAVHPPLPQSQLNADLTLAGRGDTWKDAVGTLAVVVDSSTLRNGSTPLPAHQTTLTLNAPSTDAPRVQLTGSVASGTIAGRPLSPEVRRSGRRWASALRGAVRRELAKATRSAADSTDRTVSPSRASLPDGRGPAPTAPFRVEGALTIHRMDVVRAWWPAAPDRGDGLNASGRLTVGPDTLHASGRLEAPRLQFGPRRIDSLEASYRLSGPMRPGLLSAVTTEVSARADTLHFGSQSLVQPGIDFTMRDRSGTLRARTEQIGRTGPYRLGADLTLERGLHARLTTLSAEAGQYGWTTDRSSRVRVFADAVVLDTLNLRSSHPAPDTDQHIGLSGTLSSAPTDTLTVDMSNVLLYPAGELAALPRALGGTLNGSVALTGGLDQPQIASSLQVRRLSFDRRLLGNLEVRSRLSPDSPDLLVDATLSPGAASLDSTDGPPLVPDGLRAIEENRLSLHGRVRLPGRTETSSATEEPPLDLTAEIERADLFFFKYIFDENLATARGYTAGTVHMGGAFRRPIFEADLAIENARFTLPQFGLAYSASGPITVDRRGIHLQALTVTDDGGSATLDGSVLFNDYRYFSFDLSAELDEITIIDVNRAGSLAFYGQIRASGPASLTGPLQDATLRSEGARTTPDSELYIPVSEGGVDDGTGFIVFADSTGQIPDLRDLTRRDNIFSDRPAGEPSFLEGLEIDVNVLAPEESTVHLVFDPVVGDVVTAVGSGRVQLQRQEGGFFVYGNFNVSGGTYLFTAGEVFVRRFDINGGTITWDGPPTNAQLDLEAEYRTRASRAGLPGFSGDEGRIPVRVLLDIGGRVETPRVDLSLAQVRDQRNNLVGSQTLDALLNQADRTTEYATSVLLTNTFLLTTESFTQGQGTGGAAGGDLATAGNRLAFNSVSQLVASQLNRYLGAALPNVDLNFGLQGENTQDLDLIYGVALRLLNERLIIRGEGVYTGEDPRGRQAEGPQGEFVVEVRLSNRVSVEAFYRRTGDDLTYGQTLTSSTGAGVSYQTEFPTWRLLLGRVFGWLIPGLRPPEPPQPEDEQEPPADPVARTDEGDGESGSDDDSNR